MHFIVAFVFFVLLNFATASSNEPIFFGNARFTVLTEHVIRMEWSSSGLFVDNPSFTFINRQTPKISVAYNISGLVLEIVVVPENPTMVLIYNMSAGSNFTSTNLQITLKKPSGLPSSITWHPGVPNPGLMNGSLETTDCYVGAAACLPAYYSRMQPGVLSRSGWVLIDDSMTPLFTDNTPAAWREDRPRGSGVDWYFFGHGQNYTGAMRDYTLLGGPIPLMPARAYGVWWSRYWPYDNEGIREVIEDYHLYDLPLHMLVLDIDWHQRGDAVRGCGPHIGASGCDVGYGGYAWNRTLFPDPIGFQKWVLGQNLQLMLNIHDQCGIDRCQENYVAAARVAGIDPGTGAVIPCRFADRGYVNALFRYELSSMENTLVDYYWEDYGIDMANNPGSNLSCTSAHCMWCLNDTDPRPILWSAHLQVVRRTVRNLRGLLLGVYGGLGSHRYPLVGSGDTNAAWETLAFEVYLTITAANVAVGWTHDLGGFYDANSGDGGLRDPEMLLRWFQFGAVSPVFRSHCSHCEIRAWMYPNFPLLREAFWLRRVLAPYVYGMARLGYETGLIGVRPLYYLWPGEENAYLYNATQYMLGDDFLVAPITSPVDPKTNTTHKTIWFPPGTWVRWQTGEISVGPEISTPEFGFSDIPLYVRAGGVIPLRRPTIPAGTEDPLVLAVVPGGDHGEAVFYEDDGETLDYLRGNFSKMKILQTTTAASVVLVITPGVEGEGYAGQPQNRNYELHLRGFGSGPVGVLCNGVVVNESKEHVPPGWWLEQQEGGRLEVVVVALGSFESGKIINTSINLKPPVVVDIGK